MKKIYKILFTLLIFCLTFINVNASIIKKIDLDKVFGVSSKDLDPDDIIDFPFIFYSNEENEITIDSSVSNYTMYYQWIELSETQSKALETAEETYETKVEEYKAEANRLYENYEAKFKIYEDLVNSGTASQAEIESAKADADATYNVYKNYFDTKKVELEELYEEYFKLLPDYKSEWIKSEKNEVKGDFSYYSDERQFVLYIKLETESKTIYDYGILTINGTYEETEDDKKYKTYWEEFVEKFKTVKSMEGLLDLSNNDAYSVTNTDDELKIVYTGENKTTVTTIFKYEKGIVSYVPNDDKNAIVVDSFLIAHAITALAEMKGYNLDEFLSWIELQDGKDITLAKHGIEFTSEPFKYTESSNGATTTIETNKFTKFKMDIANGIKFEKVDSDSKDEVNPDTPAPKDDTVESPKTGLVSCTLGILAVAGIAGGAYYYLRKKNLIKKI